MKTNIRKTANLAEIYILNPRKACQLALRRTRHIADRDRLDAINVLLEMHGTEAIRGEWQNGYWCDIVAVYCNAGDTYNTTVMQIRDDYQGSRFVVCSWGDFVEKHGEKLGIQ